MTNTAATRTHLSAASNAAHGDHCILAAVMSAMDDLVIEGVDYTNAQLVEHAALVIESGLCRCDES